MDHISLTPTHRNGRFTVHRSPTQSHEGVKGEQFSFKGNFHSIEKGKRISADSKRFTVELEDRWWSLKSLKEQKIQKNIEINATNASRWTITYAKMKNIDTQYIEKIIKVETSKYKPIIENQWLQSYSSSSLTYGLDQTSIIFK